MCPFPIGFLAVLRVTGIRMLMRLLGVFLMG